MYNSRTLERSLLLFMSNGACSHSQGPTICRAYPSHLPVFVYDFVSSYWPAESRFQQLQMNSCQRRSILFMMMKRVAESRFEPLIFRLHMQTIHVWHHVLQTSSWCLTNWSLILDTAKSLKLLKSEDWKHKVIMSRSVWTLSIIMTILVGLRKCSEYQHSWIVNHWFSRNW